MPLPFNQVYVVVKAPSLKSENVAKHCKEPFVTAPVLVMITASTEISGTVFNTVADILVVSVPPYGSVIVNDPLITLPTVYELSRTRETLLPKGTPFARFQLKLLVMISSSRSDVEKIISRVSLASTEVLGDMVKASITGAVLAIVIESEEAILEPSRSVAVAVQVLVHSGFSPGAFAPG